MGRVDRTNAERQARHRGRRAAAVQQAWAAKGIPGTPVLQTMPGTARWRILMLNALHNLELCREEMDDYYNERSEPWQESERGELMQERIESLQGVIDELTQVTEDV